MNPWICSCMEMSLGCYDTKLQLIIFNKLLRLVDCLTLAAILNQVDSLSKNYFLKSLLHVIQQTNEQTPNINRQKQHCPHISLFCKSQKSTYAEEGRVKGYLSTSFLAISEDGMYQGCIMRNMRTKEASFKVPFSSLKITFYTFFITEKQFSQLALLLKAINFQI